MSTPGIPTTVADIKARLSRADEEEFRALERALAADPRKGVRHAVRWRAGRLEAEARRGGAPCVALRGGGALGRRAGGRRPRRGRPRTGRRGRSPWARSCFRRSLALRGLNDSKQVSPAPPRKRSRRLSRRWRSRGPSSTCRPPRLTSAAMARCLRAAFARARGGRRGARGAGAHGAARRKPAFTWTRREVNVVKGDATCASIAAGVHRGEGRARRAHDRFGRAEYPCVRLRPEQRLRLGPSTSPRSKSTGFARCIAPHSAPRGRRCRRGLF